MPRRPADVPATASRERETAMRWDRLFADLSAELEAVERAEHEAEVADRTRSELARLRLVDRLRGSIELPLEVRVLGGTMVSGALRGVGSDWCLLQGAAGDQVVRLAAVLDVVGLNARSVEPGSEGEVAGRFSFAAVVRRLGRDRTAVTLVRTDGGLVTGTVDLAGVDVLEITDRRSDEPGWSRGSAAALRRTVPYAAIALVRQSR